MKSKKLILIAINIFCLSINTNALAQEKWKAGDPLNIKFGSGDSSLTLTPWALFRYVLTYTDEELYLNDPGNRIGFKLRQPCTKNFALFGHVELSFKMMSTGEALNFSPENATSSDGIYYNSTVSSKDQVFGLRQTYLGFDFFKYGKLTIGKQRGSYLDIADRTDISENNSGFASYAYSPEGSDGGLTGTGRANSCITYRNDFLKRIHFATSLQLNINKQTDSLNSNINSIGASAIIDIVKGLDVSVGYHQMVINNAYFDNQIIYGLSGHPSYVIVGARYKSENFLLALNYAMQQDGDMTNVNVADSSGTNTLTTVYSGSGLEVVARYYFKKFMFQAGLNQKSPEQDENKVLNSDFGRNIIFYGAQYRPVKNVAVFFEGRFENSEDANGNELPHANMLGIRVDM